MTLNPDKLTTYWQSNGVLAAADAAKDIRVAPGANKYLVVTYCRIRVAVAAAQAVTVQDDSGTVILIEIPASATGEFTFESAKGVRLTVNEKFEIVPAAAGPKIRFYAEGYIEGSL